MQVLTDAGEPRMTIHNAPWAAARARLDTLEPRQRDVYGAAMDAVDDAWTHLRPLQAWYEREHCGEGGGTDYALLLAFVDGELVDSFRLLCAGVADLVPGAAGGELDADPDDVNGWADVFARYMRVFRLAVAGADVPAPFRETVVHAADALERSGWYGSLGTLLERVEGADWCQREEERP